MGRSLTGSTMKRHDDSASDPSGMSEFCSFTRSVGRSCSRRSPVRSRLAPLAKCLQMSASDMDRSPLRRPELERVVKVGQVAQQIVARYRAIGVSDLACRRARVGLKNWCAGQPTRRLGFVQLRRLVGYAGGACFPRQPIMRAIGFVATRIVISDVGRVRDVVSVCQYSAGRRRAGRSGTARGSAPRR
jgi:hypothetical protein